MNRRLLITATVAAAFVLTAACGQQTDERTASAEASDAAEVVPTAGPSEEAIASEVAAATPYVTLDCVSLQAMPVEEPPAKGVTIGSATALFQPNGAPAITVSTTPTQATELGIADITVGEGAEVQPGDTVTVDYCGVGYGGQVVFDSSWVRGEPATFPLSSLIPGWQQGIPGMQVGGQRLLEIPGELAYGEAGTQGIGPNETLVFVIQLNAIG